MKIGTLHRVAVMAACAGLLLAAGVFHPAHAGRCTTAMISGGMRTECPSVDDPRLPDCPPGTTRVVYDLDKPFPPDGTMSTSVINTTADSPCGGATKTVGMAGYVIGCWYPANARGCRTVKVLNNGSMCLHFNDEPLGCGGPACENVSVEQVALSNAGAADRWVCPPKDPARSCRSARPNGEEKFRFWIGGFCSTQQISDGSLDNACISGWGATYYGYGDVKQRGQHLEPGWYDWATGAFKMATVTGRPQCGQLSECTGWDGRKAPWTQTLVGVPRPETPPPCFGGGEFCDPPNCVP